MDAGRVFVTLGAIFRDDGFDKYDKRVKHARSEAQRKIEASLGADLDPRAFAAYEKHLKDSRDKAERQKHFKAVLGADYDRRAFNQYERSLRNAGDESKRHFGIMGRAGRGAFGLIGRGAAGAAAVIGGAGLLGALKHATDEFEESAKVGKDTDAVIKSTGASSWTSSKQIGELANRLSEKTAVDDEAIQKSQNLLLTFSDVTDQVGKGNDIFRRASAATLDMSARFDQGLKPSAIQLGKALNDPIKGVTALQRVGVGFTQQQRDQIKVLTEHGHKLEAQKIILGEVEKQTKGSAAAQARPLDRLRMVYNNLAETIGGKLEPFLTKAANKASRFMQQMQDGRGAGGKFAKVMGDIWTGVKRVYNVLGPVTAAIVRFGGRHPTVTKLAGAIFGVSLALKALRFGSAITGFGKMLSSAKSAYSYIGRTRAGETGVAKIASAMRGAPGKVRNALSRLRSVLSGVFDRAGNAAGNAGANAAADSFSGKGRAEGVGGKIGKGSRFRSMSGAFGAFGKALGAVAGAAMTAAVIWELLSERSKRSIKTTINNIIKDPLGWLTRSDDPRAYLKAHPTGGFGINDNFAPHSPAQARRAQGGLADHPMVIVGEEAPQHPEYVIATNPAYRERNVGLWAQAAKKLGIPGFARGGALPGRSGQSSADWMQSLGDVPTGALGTQLAQVETALTRAGLTPTIQDDEVALEKKRRLLGQRHGQLVSRKQAIERQYQGMRNVPVSRGGAPMAVRESYNRVLSDISEIEGQILKGGEIDQRIQELRSTFYGWDQAGPDAEPEGLLQPTEQKYLEQLEMASALAALTKDTSDDLSAAQNVQYFWQDILNRAKQRGNPVWVTEAAQSLKSAMDAVEGIQGATATPEQLARDAAAQMDSFKGSVQDLYRSYGSNFMGRAGLQGFGALRHFGTGQTERPHVAITNHFNQQRDPHLESRSWVFEAQTAFG